MLKKLIAIAVVLLFVVAGVTTFLVVSDGSPSCPCPEGYQEEIRCDFANNPWLGNLIFGGGNGVDGDACDCQCVRLH